MGHRLTDDVMDRLRSHLECERALVGRAISPDEAAASLGITANGVWRLLKANHLELDVEASNVAKMHMVTPESLERLVERRRNYM